MFVALPVSLVFPSEVLVRLSSKVARRLLAQSGSERDPYGRGSGEIGSFIVLS